MTSIGSRGAAASPSLIDAVRSQQVRLLYAHEATSLVSVLVVSAILAGLLIWQKTLAVLPAAIWLSAVAAHTVARLALSFAYRRAKPGPADWRPWANLYVIGAGVGGLTWALGMPWLLAPDRFDLQMLVIVMMVAGTYGFVGSAGPYLPAFATFALPSVPIIILFALKGDVLHVSAAAIFLLWLPSVWVLGWRYNANLVEALTLRFENAALADDLRAQKQVAEQTSLAKSRFLAAASHDLRQPVHALGMFVGALRNQKLPTRAGLLIDHIDASVAAMDGLFTSLLDISKLDAGVVEKRVERTPLDPLIARICRDLAGAAKEKGIWIDRVPTTMAAVSDPILLERILRNLIGNAVKHTETGRILVGARRHRDRVILEVWDTGPGIPADQREAIFEEFYQLANPDRDRAKGLGLGLAIVRRLTGILGHGLSLESWPGRGSVFRVTAERAEPEPIAAEPPIRQAGASDLILAIDDEAQIRVAMAELLTSWGYEVVVAAGGDEAIDALAGGRPKLIICDYRLRDGENGVDVVRRLHAVLGAQVPDLLLTGETGP
ncbi:MAG: hybrid sensor histidine kinase/response regulator, partial [Proteobacteria bacterium]|nr:hybrid sensor histidine kinase/response regulator [Pseudomonadota bacterium]